VNIDIKTIDDITVIKIRDELNFYNAPELRSAINELIMQKKNSVILNLEKVQYIDSSGVGVLIACMMNLKRSGAGLKIAGPGRYVKKVLLTTNSIQLFDIYESEAEAVNSFCNKQ